MNKSGNFLLSRETYADLCHRAAAYEDIKGEIEDIRAEIEERITEGDIYCTNPGLKLALYVIDRHIGKEENNE